MTTIEEQQELLEAIKGPRYYNITISGYGGESSYMSISKEAHDFWAPICEEHGDSDLVTYMLSDEDEVVEYDDIDGVPVQAQFLHDNNHKYQWYESHTEFEHSYGATYGSSYITVVEVDSDEYNSDHVADVLTDADIEELDQKIGTETEWATEIVEMGCCEDPEAEYIAQMYSSEKGCFFEGVVKTIGEFDLNKLKIYTTEFLNEENTITSIEYDGVEVDNMGGDTMGKGYYASVWKNN